jgi:hypothetical protein
MKIISSGRKSNNLVTFIYILALLFKLNSCIQSENFDEKYNAVDSILSYFDDKDIKSIVCWHDGITYEEASKNVKDLLLKIQNQNILDCAWFNCLKVKSF